METKLNLYRVLLLAVLRVPTLGHAQGTFFTYEGHLADQGSPANRR